MTDRSRDDRGRFGSGAVYSREDFLSGVDEASPATTVNVAEIVGCERTTAHKRLQQLEESGEVESENLGGVLVWSVVD